MRRFLRVGGTVSIVLGATLVLFGLYEVFGTSQITKRHQADLADAFAQQIEAPGTEAPRRKARTGPAPIAKLVAPRIDLEAIVIEGTTLRELAHGPGRYRNSDAFGEKGATAVAGHRTGWGSPFINLDRLRKGDTVRVETAEATFTYRVRRTKVVDPRDTWVLGGDPASDAPSQLVLTTCTPKYTTRHRLIVFSDLVSTEPRA